MRWIVDPEVLLLGGMLRAWCGVVLRCSGVVWCSVLRSVEVCCVCMRVEGRRVEWSGGAMVSGVVRSVLKSDLKRFLMFLVHEQREREAESSKHRAHERRAREALSRGSTSLPPKCASQLEPAGHR